MMVKDEEKNLPRCLDSIKLLLDDNLAELIIVDTGSKDSTVEIAKRYTSKVYFHQWNNDFSSMRNKTISYAKGEWIFIIDADEELVKSEELVSLINSKELKSFNTIVLQVKSFNDLNNTDVAALNPSPRLFRNDGEVEYVGAVHNQPLFKEPIKVTSIILNHYGYIITDKELMEKKYQRTKAILESELEKSPNNIYYQFQLAVTYDMHGDSKEAYNQFQKSYSMLQRETDTVKRERIYLYSSFARSASLNRMFQVVIEVCLEGIRLRKDFIDLYYILGVTQRQIGDYENSITNLKQYLNLIDNFEKLEIAKDLSISLYNMDEASMENAYLNLVLNNLDLGNYIQAKSNISKLKKEENRIVCYSKLLILVNNAEDLLNFYNEIELTSKIDFSELIENKISSFKDEMQERSREIFKSLEDEYGLYNNILYNVNTGNIDTVKEFLLTYLNKFNLNKSKSYVGTIIYNIMKTNVDIYSFLVNVSEDNIDRFLKYCFVKYNNMDLLIKRYLEDKRYISDQLDKLRINKVLIKNLLLFNKNKKEFINEFYLYNKIGIAYLMNIFKSEIIDSEMTYLVSEEAAFLIFMYKADKIKKQDEKQYVKYIGKALAIYPYFKDYIEIIKDDLVITSTKNIELEQFKNEVKNNAKLLIENGNIEDAKAIIDEYEGIVTKDIDIYSMKAIIAIMENKLEEAEIILKIGLLLDINNFDLNYNLAFVYERKGNINEALTHYKLARQHCKEVDNISNLDSIINELEK
jgi:glycosyltransferase involved in cell wall biosynthesis